MLSLIDATALAVLIPIVCVASFIFMTVGFGGGVVAVPLALLFLEPKFALPVLAVIESCTVVYMLKKHHRHVVRPDAVRIILASVIGTIAGVWVLVSLPAPWLMLSMAAFITLFLVSRGFTAKSATPVSRIWAWPTGVVAGICSGAFGAGGPPAAMYFTLRQYSVNQLRSTIATTGSANLALRVSGFALAGLYAEAVVLITALCLIPFAGASIFFANKVRDGMTSRSLLWATYAILTFSAVSLTIRAQMLLP